MIEAKLVTALGVLVNSRVYPDFAPANTAKPYITYQQVGGTPINFMEAQPADKKQVRIQINVWAKSRYDATVLIRQIENLMVQSPLFGLVEGGAVSKFDEAAQARGAMQDFSFATQ